MSVLLINDYLREIESLRKFSGMNNEQVVREAFKDLLKRWARSANLHFVPEHRYASALNTRVVPDGVVLHDLRVPLGWWEAKDTDDDLDTEIVKKLKRGYPRDNVIFENSVTAVLHQNGPEVLRCDMTDKRELERLLKLFFAYERPEIAQFRAAVAQFRTDIPAVLDALRARIDTAYTGLPAFREHAARFLVTAQEAIKREFHRIPFYPDFAQWSDWGARLMDLHIGYEAVEPWPVERTDTPDVRARAAGLPPKVILKSDPAAGAITLDSETRLGGIPAVAWEYRLGNRSGLDWVLDQHKEKTPKDPTIPARFNTYRFADHKERVADLLACVARVSVETVEIVAAMRAVRRDP